MHVQSRRLTLGCLILVAGLLHAAPLPAQPIGDTDVQDRKAHATCLEASLAERWAEALPACQAAVQADERLFGPEHVSVAWALRDVGRAHVELRNAAAAIPLYQRSLRILEKELGAAHGFVATALNGLALLYQDQGRYAEAEPLFLRSLRIAEKALGSEHPDVATALNNLAGLYQAQGRYAETEPVYKRSLGIREKTLGSEHPDVATALNNLAEVYQAQGRYADAEPLYTRSLPILEKALGSEHPHVATSLNNLALLYRLQGRYAEAEPLYTRSLRIREKALGSEHPHVATSLDNLAQLHQAQGRYADAEPLYTRSLPILEKALGSEHPQVATSLNNLAQLYQAQGRYADAEPLYTRSLRIWEKALGSEHPHVATSLDNLAQLYQAQGRYADAEPLYTRSLRIWEKALGSEHPHVATSLNNLASLYQAQGRYADAEPLYTRSLRIWEKALGSKHPDVATSLNNLATLYEAQGRYADAEPLYTRSLRIREKALGSEHPHVATSLNNLANLYQTQGRYADAEPLYTRSLPIREKALGSEHPDVAASLNNLATLYEAQGRYAEAEPQYTRSLRIAEKALGSEHPHVATSLNNLASFYVQRDDLKSALPLLQTLWERSLKRNGLFHALSLDTLEVLVRVHEQLGEGATVGALWTQFLSKLQTARPPSAKTAEGVYRQVAVLLERSFYHRWLLRQFKEAEEIVAQVQTMPLAKERVIAAALRRMQAQRGAISAGLRTRLTRQAGFAQGREDAHALRLLSSGMEEAEGRREAVLLLREGLYLGERHLRRQKSVKTVAAWLEQERPYLDLIFERVRTQPLDADTLELAWMATLLSKGRTLDAETQALRVLRDPRTVQNNQQAMQILAQATNAYRQGALNPQGMGELRSLGRSRVDLQDSLSQSIETSRIETLPEPFELVRKVAAALPKDGVLVDFVEYVPPPTPAGQRTARYLALLLFPADLASEPRMQALDLGEVAGHAPRIGALLEALRNPNSHVQPHAQAVYDALLAPVRKAAGAVAHLWLVPDGALNLIPFDALHDGKQYLLDGPLAIRYLGSGRDLVFSYGASSGRPPLVLGNPALDAVVPRPQAQAEAAGTKQRGGNADSLRWIDDLGSLSALPGAEAEAQQIASLLHVSPLLGAKASEPALRAHLGKGLAPRILHLAMHGVFRADLATRTALGTRANPVAFAPGVFPQEVPSPAEAMLQSALLLAGADRAREATDSSADGVLFADEARDLPLEGTEVVVLSACQTALGSIRTGEGVYGLRRAFLSAGAEAVVASLWRVADSQTSTLMTAYYKLLIDQKVPRIRAMRQAMLEIKKTNPHPYYWAPFIAIGRDAAIRPLDILHAKQR